LGALGQTPASLPESLSLAPLLESLLPSLSDPELLPLLELDSPPPLLPLLLPLPPLLLPLLLSAPPPLPDELHAAEASADAQRHERARWLIRRRVIGDSSMKRRGASKTWSRRGAR